MGHAVGGGRRDGGLELAVLAARPFAEPLAPFVGVVSVKKRKSPRPEDKAAGKCLTIKQTMLGVESWV